MPHKAERVAEVLVGIDGKASDSYSGVARFELRHGHRPSLTEVASDFSQSLLVKAGQCVLLDHYHILPHHLYFVIRQSFSHTELRLANLKLLRASLN